LGKRWRGVDMNNDIVNDLAEMKIFDCKYLSEEEFEKASKNNDSKNKLYIQGNYSDNVTGKWFKEIDTHGYDAEDIQIRLQMETLKKIKSIKMIVIFLLIITIMGIIGTNV